MESYRKNIQQNFQLKIITTTWENKMEKSKAQFLSRYNNPNARALAAYLYELERNIVPPGQRISDAVREIVDFDDEIDEKEFAIYKIPTMH